MHERYHGRYYAKAQNLARSLREAYDAALRDADLLVMPTTPQKATRKCCNFENSDGRPR